MTRPGGRRGIATGASFHPYEALATTSLVYRRAITAIGVSGKYDRQQVGAEVRDAWAGDVGVAIAVFDIMAFGVGLVGRLGYATRPAITEASRMTFGGGVVLGRLAMDCAFQSYGVLDGGTHRVGLRWTP